MQTQKGKHNIYSSNGELYMHKHTGQLTMQVWSALANDAPDAPDAWMGMHPFKKCLGR
jgi:hypothetical protein